MLRNGNQADFIRSRVNMPTGLSHAELVQKVSPKIKAQAFFSARVANARILEKLRSISDGYSRGEFGLADARNQLKDFLRAEGYDPHQAGLRNLASTARLNLVLRQNAAMAHAAGEWARMRDPDALQVFPYVRYHARRDNKVRSSHSDLDGKIFHKLDPFLKTHTPPWEFNCRCYLEEITAKEAGKEPEKIQKPTPPEQVKVESSSGFSFDPEHVFEEFDLQSVNDPRLRGEIKETAAIEYGSQISVQENIVRFEQKNFHTWQDEKLKPAADWKEENLPTPPEHISVDEAKQKLSAGEHILSATGEVVVFDNKCVEHWQVVGKSIDEINDRLTCLTQAFDTVTNPLEVWDQGNQKGYIKLYKKNTGGFKGLLVFVLKDGSAKTYFIKDVNALNKARKGFSVQIFTQM